jgi:hypothetical protein
VSGGGFGAPLVGEFFVGEGFDEDAADDAAGLEAYLFGGRGPLQWRDALSLAVVIRHEEDLSGMVLKSSSAMTVLDLGATIGADYLGQFNDGPVSDQEIIALVFPARLMA